ncbi:pantoate--beta-alanine ligase [Luteimonas terricola]|uniref:Pantothenate synthetase n=1 Tax=Luteimonas terricola TaxID=645597 RepID=A0ABQ2EGN7_9GAMM|nr:pantoate--beta-alanine ligase [Luteimonas terricola]GGK08438.1 pantothenate synthetase [Luteimonas terricola]
MSGAIEVARKVQALRARIDAWKRDGLRIGFVPTMGNLHEGHYSLVRLARANVDQVVASIFVNPTQFGPGEDYDRYPRTPDADLAGLEAAGCDLAWMPALDEMYPLGTARAVRVQVPGITDVLDGAHRPGHFDGVCTVVARLFNQVRPDLAVFGRKDYQQLAVIRHMVLDLAFPVELVGADIVRESDGLARSSRNQYLSAEERALAPEIHRTLLAVRDAVQAGQGWREAEADAAAGLQAAGFVVDYAVVRTPLLAEPSTSPGSHGDGGLVALVAARLGRTRLIDNLEFSAAA